MGSSERRRGELTHGLAVERLRRRLGSREPRRFHIEGFRAAAVAVMLREIMPPGQGGVPHVTLTQRAAALRAHSGQVSLPGGVRDAEDASAVATAVRESREEIGIDPDLLRLIGTMDDELTTSGYVITPVVFELVERPRYVPNPAEVAHIFEAPLGVFADPGAAEYLGERHVRGHVYPVRAYAHDGYRITGATARILEQVHALAMATTAAAGA